MREEVEKTGKCGGEEISEGRRSDTAGLEDLSSHPRDTDNEGFSTGASTKGACCW